MTNWIKVDGFKNYSVNEAGQVRNDKRGRILTPLVLSKGYHGYRLYINKRVARTIKAHRIVAIAHIPNPNKLPQVNHKDGIKAHNYISNLEWATNLDNMQHAYNTGIKKNEFKYKDKIPNVFKLSKLYSQRKVGEMLGIPKSTINYMLNNCEEIDNEKRDRTKDN